MFVCTECGEKFKEKPDFCNCGNDEFSEVYETLPSEGGISRKRINSQKDLLSWLFFIFCLILSVLVLLFFPKVDENRSGNTQSKPTNVVKTTNPNIPDVETFWVNPSTGVLEPVEHVSPVEQIKEVFKPKKEPVKKNNSPEKKQKTTNVTQKTKSQTSPKVNNAPAKPQAQKNVSKPAPASTVQNQVKTSQPVSNMYEFVNYKNKLRNTLLSNLRLSSVEGSGKCGIEFAIAPDGKLINRGFIYQSENKTVNDAIYKMLMRTPRFLPPPEAYKGEMIKMVFQLNNTSYAIDYMN